MAGRAAGTDPIERTGLQLRVTITAPPRLLLGIGFVFLRGPEQQCNSPQNFLQPDRT